MLNIVVVGFDSALASAITGVMDLFALAGVTWNRVQGEEVGQHFNVRIASPDGGSIHCINGIQIAAQLSYANIKQVDALIVPTIGGPIEQVLSQRSEERRVGKERRTEVAQEQE